VLRIPRAEWKDKIGEMKKGAGDDGGGPRAAAEVAFRNAAFLPPLAGGGGSKRPRVRADTSSSLGAAARALCIAHPLCIVAIPSDLSLVMRVGVSSRLVNGSLYEPVQRALAAPCVDR
jgi:hypothetical protein